jgi:thymidylate synthase
MDQVALQLTRTPKALPTLKIARIVDDLFAFRFDDFAFEGYDPDPAIRAPVAV